MATNRHLPRVLLAIVLLCGFAPFLFAQSAGYFIDTQSAEPRFIQRLFWSGGEHALRYEVVVEREVDGEYITYLRESTGLSFIEVSLPPGFYRYQVISYDILDRPEEESRWENFEVRLAVQPEVFDVWFESVSGDRTDETPGYVLNISGNNLVPGAEFIIRHSDGTQFIPETLDSGEDGNARIFINRDDLTHGEYELIVRNPGGLEANVGEIVFLQLEPEDKMSAWIRPIMFFGSAAWAPVIPVHGDFFGTGFSPAGAGARIGAVFAIPIGIHLGAELTAFWHINNAYADNDDLVNMLSAGANLVAMKWLPNQITALTFRLGVSYAILPDTEDKLMLNIGASYLWRITRLLMLETGVDYTARLSDGCIRPWIGIGIMF